MKRWRLKLSNGWAAIAALFGVGLLPCPDCGLPMAVHTWPLAFLIWAFRRVRQRQVHRLDLLLQDDQGHHSHPVPETAGTPQSSAAD
jgi:hypothetical protein